MRPPPTPTLMGRDGQRPRMPDDDPPDPTHVVTVFLRHDADVLLVRRSETSGPPDGQWDAVGGPIADGGPPSGASGTEGADPATGDPEQAARAAVAERGFDPGEATLVRAGDALTVSSAGDALVVHPFLFEAATRAVEDEGESVGEGESGGEGGSDHEWVPPTEILRRETVPWLWDAYDRVRPTVETIRADRNHGSASLSVRALEVLRDEAAVAVERGGDWRALAATGRALRDARPAMPVVANRVNRAMAAASDERTPAAVESAAADGLDRALTADADAAARAAEAVPDRVATLSRSGTVLSALARADPGFVLVAESRPGREGVAMAEAVAAETGTEVLLATDAAMADRLAETGVEAVVVGADAVRPDGSVVNKVGTRGVAAAAASEGLPCYVVAASDKVATEDTLDREPRDPAEVYDGDADVTATNPTFGVTPASLVTAVVTETGRLDGEAVRALAAAHRKRAAWDTADE